MRGNATLFKERRTLVWVAIQSKKCYTRGSDSGASARSAAAVSEG